MALTITGVHFITLDRWSHLNASATEYDDAILAQLDPIEERQRQKDARLVEKDGRAKATDAEIHLRIKTAVACIWEEIEIYV